MSLFACRFAGTLLITFALSAVASAAPAARQSPLPPPTGRYAVGRTELVWVDPSRAAVDDSSGHREIAVWVWYPAASPAPGAEAAQWMPGQWGEEFWALFLRDHEPNLPAENFLAAIRSHAYEDAPLSSQAKTYPILLFEPGLGVIPLAYASLVEDMASHGYIVVGIDPTGYTQFTILSGGRVVKDNLPPRTQPPSPEEMLKNERTRRVVWTGDMSFVLDRLAKLNADIESPFARRLDLNRVGAFGHSYGGTASLQLAKDDRRIRAVIDLDGMQRADPLKAGIAIPVLLFRHPVEEDAKRPNADEHRPPIEPSSQPDPWEVTLRAGDPGYLLTLAHSAHMNFSDVFLLSSDFGRQLPPTAIDPARGLTVVRAYVGAFFDEYLNGKTSPLLNGPSAEYPEVTFQTNK